MIGTWRGIGALAGAAIITVMIVAASAFAQGAAPVAVPASAAPVDTIPIDTIAVDTVTSKIIPPDTAASRIIPADTAAFKAIPADTAASRIAPADNASAPAPLSGPLAAPPRRPRTREELGRMSREELFRLAFGREAPDRPRSLMMRLFGEGRAIGTVEIAYNENFSSFTFSSSPFSRLLDRQILPEYRAAAGDSAGHFTSAVLTAAGYSLDVNETRYELRVLFPPEAKVLQKMNLRGGFLREPRGEEIEPAAVSFYANYSAEARVRYMNYLYYQGYGGPRDEVARDPIAVNFDGALNVYGWVLESSGWVSEPASGALTWESFSRGDARVVREFAGLRSKLLIGDVSIGSSLMSGPTVGGVRYEHNGWFFGNNPSDDQNSVTFFMAKAGELEVFIDGTFRRRFSLPGGRHQVSGFGGEVGRNTVRLVLRASDGTTEEIPFEYVLSHPRNLARGDVRYALAGGVSRASAPPPVCFTYDAGLTLAGAELMYGLHQAVSVGLSGQASQMGGLVGTNILWSVGSAGFVDARFFASHAGMGGEGAATGGRAEASYTVNLRRPIAKMNRLLTGGVEYAPLPDFAFSVRGYGQSERYAASAISAAVAGSSTVLGGASGEVGMPFFRGSLYLSGGATANRAEGGGIRDPHPLDYNYGLRVAQSVKKSYFSFSAGENVVSGLRSPYFNFGSSFAFGTRMRIRNHQLSATANAGMSTSHTPAVDRPIRYTQEQLDDPDFDGPEFERVPGESTYDLRYGANAGWAWANDINGIGARSYSADAAVLNNLNPSANASARHVYNRANVVANYFYSNGKYLTYDRLTHTVRAQMQGSFMFADGLWAFGRQMDGFGGGGFALVNTKGDLKKATVHINRTRYNSHGLSKSGWLGAAYYNRMMPYSPTEFALSLSDVPVGAILEQNRYHVMGGYKQGYALRIGRIEQVIALVRFLDRGGRPLAYHYLTVEPEGEEDIDAPPRAAFTNSDGILQLGGLQPGLDYRVKFRASTNIKDVVIEIPVGADPVFEHSDVIVEREE